MTGMKMKETYVSSFNQSKGMSKGTGTLTSTDWQSVGHTAANPNDSTDPRILALRERNLLKISTNLKSFNYETNAQKKLN